MKRILAALAALAIANVALPLPAQASVTATNCANLAGVGSSGDPFLIETQADLMAVSTCNTAAGGAAHFAQTTNIVLQGDWVPLGIFDGSYDGNDFSISGLNINNTSQGLAGLFSQLDGATVRNLTILANDLIGQSYAGIVAGHADNAVIDNVRAKNTGIMNVIQGAGCLLGSAGQAITLTNVLADCNTDASMRWAGGLVAYLGAFINPVTDLTISNAYVRGNLNFSENGGGVAAILTSTDTDAQISGFTFAGTLLAPDSETALVGGIFGSASSASTTTAPKTTITNSSVRGTISSLLVTEDPDPPQIIITPSSTGFSIATTVDKDTTPFSPSPSVGKVFRPSNVAATPQFVLSNMILAPKYGTPAGSDGYQVTVGTPATKGLPTPSCVFHTQPPTASFEYNQVANLTLVTQMQLLDPATFDGCLTVVDGAENVTDSDIWVKDSSVFQGDVWGAQLVRLGLHESTLDYGQTSFEIAHDQTFNITNASTNLFPEFTISPALPAGITLEAHTGRILGSANGSFGPTSYTVTRTSLFGFPTETTNITLSQLAAPAPPPPPAPAPTVEPSPEEDPFAALGLRFVVKEMANGDFKLYAFSVVNQGKIQFMVDGREMAWVRATNTSDPKLRSITRPSGTEHYFVRTLRNPGAKAIEFYLNGQLAQTHN